MATQNQEMCAYDDPAGGRALISVDFDDVSLLITTVRWQDLTTRHVNVQLTDPGTSLPIPGASANMAPGTQPASASVSGQNLHMVNRTNPKTGVTVPAPPFNCSISVLATVAR